MNKEKTRLQVESIAESGALVDATGNLFYAQFDARAVSNMSDLECYEFMNAMEQIDNIVSEVIIEAIVENAISYVLNEE